MFCLTNPLPISPEGEMDLQLLLPPWGRPGTGKGVPKFIPYFVTTFFTIVAKLHNIFTTDVKLSIAMIMPQLI